MIFVLTRTTCFDFRAKKAADAEEEEEEEGAERSASVAARSRQGDGLYAKLHFSLSFADSNSVFVSSSVWRAGNPDSE